MKIQVKFLKSSDIPLMTSDIEQEMDSRFCIKEIPFVFDDVPRGCESYDEYIFKKIETSSKPKLYEFSHVQKVLRCCMITMKGKRCLHWALPNNNLCPTHFHEYKKKVQS